MRVDIAGALLPVFVTGSTVFHGAISAGVKAVTADTVRLHGSIFANLSPSGPVIDATSAAVRVNANFENSTDARTGSITFGTDTNLYRLTADYLATNDSMVIAGGSGLSVASLIAQTATNGFGYIEQADNRLPRLPPPRTKWSFSPGTTAAARRNSALGSQPAQSNRSQRSPNARSLHHN